MTSKFETVLSFATVKQMMKVSTLYYSRGIHLGVSFQSFSLGSTQNLFSPVSFIVPKFDNDFSAHYKRVSLFRNRFASFAETFRFSSGYLSMFSPELI